MKVPGVRFKSQKKVTFSKKKWKDTLDLDKVGGHSSSKEVLFVVCTLGEPVGRWRWRGSRGPSSHCSKATGGSLYGRLPVPPLCTAHADNLPCPALLWRKILTILHSRVYYLSAEVSAICSRRDLYKTRGLTWRAFNKNEFSPRDKQRHVFNNTLVKLGQNVKGLEARKSETPFICNPHQSHRPDLRLRSQSIWQVFFKNEKKG